MKQLNQLKFIKMETTQGNRMIAEFMGLKPRTMDGNSFYWSDSPFYHVALDTEEQVMQAISEYAKYHESWDWLMPVVETIEGILNSKLNPFEVSIHSKACQIYSIGIIKTFGSDGSTKIEAVWLAVLKFIEWYNEKP